MAMETNMTKGKPLPILLKFVFPLMLGNIFQQLYNMADTVIVGNYVGPGALAAVGSTGTIMFLVIGLSQGLSTGFTVLTAQTYGAGDSERTRRSVSNAIFLSILVAGILTTVFVLTMRQILELMHTPQDIFADAYSYILIICFGITANIFYNLGSALLRAVGNSRIPLYVLVFAAVLNVILDLVFIIGFHMGVAGAPLATDIAQGISAVLCFIYIREKIAVLRPRRGEWRLRRDMTARQLAIGVPMALQFAITASGAMIMQTAVNRFGSVAVEGYTGANKLGSLLTQGMPAMGQAMATYAGQNFGDRQYRRVREGVRAALLIEVVYALIASGIGVLLLKPAIGLFFSEDVNIAALLPWAKTYAYLTYCFYIPLSIIFNFRNTMQGCGYGFLPMLGGVSELVARLITAALSIRSHSYLLACACDPAAWVAAAVVTGIGYLIVMRDIRKKYMS
jgi:putative MATE family efflux protein